MLPGGSQQDVALFAHGPGCRLSTLVWPHHLQETTLNSFNDALGPVGVKVSAPEAGHPADSQWLVSDGRSLFRFTDGMVRASDGPASKPASACSTVEQHAGTCCNRCDGVKLWQNPSVCWACKHGDFLP
jgi:hypothetical protein